MKILFVSNLFPDTGEPIRGLDNARLLGHLAPHCDIRVVALRPVRWLWPFRRETVLQWRPEDERFKPFYLSSPYIPKVGSRWNHRLMARALGPTLERIRAEFPFDTVLVSWLYPDGCAVGRLSERQRFKFVAIAQGSDAHQYLRIPARRRAIVSEMSRASAVVTRSKEIGQLLHEAGVAREKIHAIYNGVDFRVYGPGEQREARAELGLPVGAPIILYVGNFLPIKNPLLAVVAHEELSRVHHEARLVMLGDGPLLESAREATIRRGTDARVTLAGRQPPSKVARYMQAADILCIPSHNEGLPNVVLEAFACGLRVVSTRVGGIPELVRHDFLGQLVEPANSPALTRALAGVLAQTYDQKRIVEYARQFSWAKTTGAHLELLQKACGK